MRGKRTETLVYWLAGIMILLALLSVAYNSIAQEPTPAERAAEAVAAEPATISDPAPATPAERPRIDVVFVLDTTGSMGSLIDGAKRKIWSILNSIASGKPTPDIRVGLVAYRDRSDQYVTQLNDLTDDLDAMYEKLMSFRAHGGGDTPESVNQALYEAVTKTSWAEGDDVLKIVFLVGDAPPHMDYSDDVKYPKTCEAAVRRNIIINTVQCGSIGGTDKIWKEIADRSEGTYVAIAQSGGMKAIRTPYDEEIAKLDRELRGTSVYYGRAPMRARAKAAEEKTEVLLEAAPVEAVADRAYFMGTAGRRVGGAFGSAGTDLVTALDEGSVKIDKLEDEKLPDELKALSPEDRETYIKERAAKRGEIQKKLQQLNKQRGEFIAEQTRKAAAVGGERDAFDLKVIDSVRKHATKIGVKYEGEKK